MDPAASIASLSRFPATLTHLVSTLPLETWRWRPSDGGWSVLEVVHHLLDEERDDFRARLQLTLESPGTAWPPIDPASWPAERGYNDADPQAILAGFLDERQRSLDWLSSLGDPAGVDWLQSYDHPKVGPVTAATLLVSWAAHDLLHLRQITKRLYEQLAADASPHDIGYAGAWPEAASVPVS